MTALKDSNNPDANEKRGYIASLRTQLWGALWGESSSGAVRKPSDGGRRRSISEDMDGFTGNENDYFPLLLTKPAQAQKPQNINNDISDDNIKVMKAVSLSSIPNNRRKKSISHSHHGSMSSTTAPLIDSKERYESYASPPPRSKRSHTIGYNPLALNTPNMDHEIIILEDLDWLHSETERIAREAALSPPKMTSTSKILKPKSIAQLVLKLPITLQFDTWTLLYSVLDHGADFSTFYNRVSGNRYTLIVVETNHHEIFGGFGDAEWKMSSSYFGGGECFLFRVGK